MMDDLSVTVKPSSARPGSTLRCLVRWRGAAGVKRLVVNLLWYTEGEGAEDIRVVVEETLEDPGPSGEREVQFVAPSHPPSFTGRLVSLKWAVEALAEPESKVSRAAVVIGPAGKKLRLPSP